MLASLAFLAVAAGPVLDPVAQTIDASDLERLPSGRHLGYEADHELLSVVNLAPGDGGFDRFDRLALSMHGRSTTQLRLLLDGLDITDPARPGNPLVELPDGAWDRLTMRSLWTDQPGFEWTVAPSRDEPLHYGASGGWGQPVGGGPWVPRDFMDREPADQFGAPHERRALTDVRELTVEGRAAGARVLAEYDRDGRELPVTFVDAAGRPLVDLGERTTALGAYTFAVGPVPVTALVAWQRTKESAFGAAYRWPAEITGPAEGTGLVAQLTSRGALAGWELWAGYGLGWRSDTFASSSGAPLVSDLEGEWQWMMRPRLDETLDRWRHDLAARAETRRGSNTWSLELRGSYATLSSLESAPGGVAGHTWDRAPDGDRSAYLDVYDPARTAREWLASGRANVRVEHRGSGYELEGVVALDWAAVGTPGSLRLGSLAPAAGALLRVPVGGGRVFALVRREPDALTEEVSAFLDPARPSGRRYAWEDDGDGVPSAGEAGALVSRFGGPFDRAADGLRRPTSNQLSVGWVTPRFGPFTAVVSAVGRMHLDRYTVRYDDATAAGFTPVALAPYDQGTYHVPYAGRVPDTAYARTGEAGSETYVLDNDSRFDWWLGTELALTTVDTRTWFLTLAAAGYWNEGPAPFGTFADRNDAGVVSAVSADPNASINDHGRYDQDRSFSIKLLAGRRFFERLLLATSLRYRDGEPFVAYGVVEGLPQGPTAIMLEPRGRARHTFHMSLDLRAAYTLDVPAVDGLAATLAADVFNLLGSGTELLEDPHAGETWRDPLEMMPGRSVFVRLSLGWR